MRTAVSTSSFESRRFWRGFGAKRAVIVAAHPDDETIGCACAITALKDKPWIIFVTTGSPGPAAAAPDHYAKRRRREALEALGRLGLPATRVSWLGFGDQRSAFAIPNLVEKLVEKFGRLRPQIVLTHAYEGGHPDHDTTAFGVYQAIELRRRVSGDAPLVLEFCSYHQGEGSEPRLEPSFLPPEGDLISCKLSEGERKVRRSAFDSYRSQSAILSCFSLEREQFRRAPLYDFSHPPHAGKLYFEYFDWGISGAEWRQLAQSAARQLGLNSNGSTTIANYHC